MVSLHDRVWVRPAPGCPAEGVSHGFYPYLRNGPSGIVIDVEGDINRRYPDHLYMLLLDSGLHGWFTARELETLDQRVRRITGVKP